MASNPRFLLLIIVSMVIVSIGDSPGRMPCMGKASAADPVVDTSEAAIKAPAVAWPQWRGGDQNGVAPKGDFPSKWSEKSGVKWRTELPGVGGSTPVVSGEYVFLTAGVDGQNTLMAFNLESGEKAWDLTLGSDRGNKHRKGSGSNPSPAVDGSHVFAYFRSGDLACVDFDGKTKWQINLQQEFGEDTLWWDLGTSPMLINDLVVVAVMQSGPSYLIAYDRKSGKLAWKTDRMLGAPEEAAQSYSTPVILDELNGIAVMGADHLTIHSAADGRELGRVSGFNPDAEKYFRSIASPVVVGDLVVCPYSRGATLTGCRIEDVIDGKDRKSVVWHRDDLGSDVPSPAALDGRVYVVGDTKPNKGTVTAVNAENGQTIWSVKLPKSRIGYSGSPLIVGNHLLVTGEDATTHVIGPLDATQPELLESNRLADNDPFTVASPVPYGDDLLIRTRHSIYRIGKD